MRRLKLMMAAILAGGVPVPTAAQSEFDAQRLAAIDRHFASETARGARAGYVLLIAHRGRVVHQAAIGAETIDGGNPMRLETCFRLASMTKPITSVAAMMLVEQGRLQLSDPVARYIPAYKNLRVSTGRLASSGEPETVAPTRSMTVLDLMTHTSGLGGNAKLNAVMPEIYGRLAPRYFGKGTLAEKADLLAASPLWFQPGHAFGYGIYSTDVLGRVVEVAADEPLDAFIGRTILRPLGMRNTGFLQKGRKVPNLADLHISEAGKLTAQHDHALDNLTAPHGGGGMYSTVGDYHRFLEMLLNRGSLDGVRLLSPATIEWMTRNALPESMLPIGREATTLTGGFGLGFGVAMTDKPIGHSPLVPGDYYWGGSTDTLFFVSPRRKMIAIIFSQSDLLSRPDWRTWGDFAAMASAALVE